MIEKKKPVKNGEKLYYFFLMQTLSYTKNPEKHIGLETFMLPLAVKKWSDVAVQRMVQLTGMTFH